MEISVLKALIASGKKLVSQQEDFVRRLEVQLFNEYRAQAKWEVYVPAKDNNGFAFMGVGSYEWAKKHLESTFAIVYNKGDYKWEKNFRMTETPTKLTYEHEDGDAVWGFIKVREEETYG